MNEEVRDLSASALALTQAGARWSHLFRHFLTWGAQRAVLGAQSDILTLQSVSCTTSSPLCKAASVQTTTHAPGCLEKTARSEVCSQVLTNRGMRVLGQGPSRTEVFLAWQLEIITNYCLILAVYSAFCVLTHLVLTTTCYHFLHFPDG